MDPDFTDRNPHIGATKWGFARLELCSSGSDPQVVEAVLDQMRMRAATFNDAQRATALEIANRIKVNPITNTVRQAAEDLIRAYA